MKNENVTQTHITKEKTENECSEEKDLIKCDVCGEYHDKNITHGFKVKGKKKYICQGCADTIHGLV